MPHKFDVNASNLVLMPHKFDINASNLVLMPKKTDARGHYNFIFFLNHVLCKTERTPREPKGRTPSIFHVLVSYIFSSIVHLLPCPLIYIKLID
jgi:hypothetical protein